MRLHAAQRSSQTKHSCCSLQWGISSLGQRKKSLSVAKWANCRMHPQHREKGPSNQLANCAEAFGNRNNSSIRFLTEHVQILLVNSSDALLEDWGCSNLSVALKLHFFPPSLLCVHALTSAFSSWQNQHATCGALTITPVRTGLEITEAALLIVSHRDQCC